MPKHRRSDTLPAPAHFGAPADVADYWPDPVSYSHAGPVAGRPAVQQRPYPAGDDYYDYEYDGAVPDRGWAPVPDERSWREWEDWQGRVAPPIMHPDHPSAPVPLVQFPDWQQSGSYYGDSDPLDHRPDPAGLRLGNGYAPASDSLWPTQALVGRQAAQAAQAAQQAQDQAAQILDTAEREADSITQQATGEAAAIRKDAELEAAAIREAADRQAAAIRIAAERDAAELRAALDSMCGELGRVTAYVTENLSSPAMLAIAPPLPTTTRALPPADPGLPGARPDLPGSRTAPPATRPRRPETSPGARPAGPVRPRTAPTAVPPAKKASKPGPGNPARQTATPPAKKGQAQGRQRRAMRVATAGTAALVSIAAIGAATYTGIHGFSFFVFRESGQGETPGNFTDAKFLARQAAAQHHESVPKGRHHKAAGSQSGHDK